jgi:hypothetical protein
MKRSGEFTVVQSKGAALVPLVNRLSFDAMIGHWDFAYNPAHLRAHGALGFPGPACGAPSDCAAPPTRSITRTRVREGEHYGQSRE